MIDECFDCGSHNISDCGDKYLFDDCFFGRLTSGNHHVFRCLDCGLLLLDDECRVFLDGQRRDIMERYLNEHCNPSLCQDEYMSESEVVEKIGFIPELAMKTRHEGKTLFWKKSIDKFKENGADGRINIV